MDVVSTLNAAAPTSARTTNEDQEPSSASLLAADFDNFLNLLTAQLRAQDPLSPVESTQFVEQLASFSSVEQQINTNTKLDQIAASLGNNDLDSLAQWIGKGVETRAENIRFTGTPIQFSAPDANSFESVSAAVTDADGEVIAVFPLDKDAKSHIWDGRTSDGARALNGDYSIELRYERDGKTVKTDTAPQFDTVREVRLLNEGWRLNLEGGRAISVDDVTAVLS